ncbi:MAG: hypothetical protein H6Q60_597 [Oscillospiraceae bacterium]|nr:hypothetical protein [Oscillospiraceae bacterium]
MINFATVMGFVFSFIGIYYLMRPEKILKKRYERMGEEIPQKALLRTRIIGGICTVGGLIIALTTYFQ